MVAARTDLVSPNRCLCDVAFAAQQISRLEVGTPRERD
jgi:hypothetical protein